LFGTERNIALLIAILNAVLQLPSGAEVVAVELLNPFQEKNLETDKLTILDVKARDASGRLFSVEMQLLVVSELQARILYYWAKLHQGQLTAGEDYAALRPTVTILFVNEELFADVPGWHSQFELRERQAAVVFSDQLQIHVLEISKFNLSSEELHTPLERWMYFMKHGAELDPEQLPQALHEPVYQQAIGELQQMTQNDPDRERYEARLKAQRDFATTVREREQRGYLKGRSEGLIREIHFCQRLLRQPLTAVEQLRAQSVAELEQLVQKLEALVDSSRGGQT
jgi:predicted transposase/invertase (TIGR01784 family)